MTATALGGLTTDNLHAALTEPALTSMNLLNEVAARYPDAISFAAGRPTERFFDVNDVHRYLGSYHDHLVRERHYTESQARAELLQYGRTKGIVHELVARNLAVDEGIQVDPESIVVTVGCQEGMVLVLRALRADQRDVVLAVAPTYVGFTGAARLVDMPVLSVRDGPTGVCVDHLVDMVHESRAAGLRPRACYVVPEFANPSGLTLDLTTRRQLLEVADEEDLLLLEDNPYGMFRASGRRLPTLKALDKEHRVVYLGSFAKTALPGARVGYVIADQQVRGSGSFADELSKIKSMITLNTSPIAQAIIGGKLLECDCSLIAATARETQIYADNLKHMLHGLASRFDDVDYVRWNTPDGGFFVVLDVDCHVDDDLLEESAARFGVLWTPMCHFYGGTGGHHQLRLSCSVVTPVEIELGLDRLAALLAERAMVT